jgi:hypothetical protein
MSRLYSAAMHWPWFAIAFALYPILHIAAANPGQVDALALILAVVTTLVASSALLFSLRLLLGNWIRAGLGTTWFVILFFAYGPLNAWIIGMGGDPDQEVVASAFWSGERLQIIHSLVWLVLLVLGWFLLRRMRATAVRLQGALNLVSGLLLALALFQWFASTDRHGDAAKAQAGAVAIPENRPDIYFILLDGYSRADVLGQHYDFDNSPFLQGLERRGFQVADASASNYNWTLLSLASTLNMDFVQDLVGDSFDPHGRDREAVYRLLRDNRAAAFLRARGYRFVHLQSTWGGTGRNPYADDFLPCGGGMFRDDFLLAIWEASWLRVLGSSATMDLADCHLRNFKTLAALAREPGPKFVFAHFVLPHHPYLFDRNGNVLRYANLSNQFEFQKQLWEDRAAYIEQLEFVNSRIGVVLDRLISDSAQTPIVLLQSDHGTNLRRGLKTDEYYRIRLANLNAVLLPGAPVDLMPENPTAVNLFRFVFDHYFDAGLPFLPDRRFVSPFQQPFDFTEVDGNGARLEAVAD